MKYAALIQQSWPAHFVRSTDEWGDACYFVIRTPQARFEQLQQQRRLGPIDIADYGEILLSGFGDYPTPALRAQLERDHGVSLPEKL